MSRRSIVEDLLAPPPTTRLGYLSLGSLALHPRRRVRWIVPVSCCFGAQRIIMTVKPAGDFSIVIYGWRVGALGVDFGGEFSPVATRQEPSIWLHPMHGRAHIDAGQSIDLDVENVGPRAVLAAAGLVGVLFA